MIIALVADEPKAGEFFLKDRSPAARVNRYATIQMVPKEAEVLFYLVDEEELMLTLKDLLNLTCVIVVNCVTHTLQELPQNVVRINSWPGFLQREIVEVVAQPQQKKDLDKIFAALGWQYKLVADIPGMVAARVIAMIINEAFYALEDDVSTRSDIDVAMKYGTNYPFGPFEWGAKIGWIRIITLLQQLSRQNARYAPARLLLKEIGIG